MNHFPLILGSSSIGRLRMLQDVGIIPDSILVPNIDETPIKKELPRSLATRLSIKKCKALEGRVDKAILITADTVCSAGRAIVSKAANDDDVRYCLQQMSGRRNNVYTSLTVSKIIDYKIDMMKTKLVSSIIQFKRLTHQEIESYVETKEGIGKAGGCSITGRAQLFFSFISGSYSNIVGLPLFELNKLLTSAGYQVNVRVSAEA